MLECCQASQLVLFFCSLTLYKKVGLSAAAAVARDSFSQTLLSLYAYYSAVGAPLLLRTHVFVVEALYVCVCIGVLFWVRVAEKLQWTSQESVDSLSTGVIKLVNFVRDDPIWATYTVDCTFTLKYRSWIPEREEKTTNELPFFIRNVRNLLLQLKNGEAKVARARWSVMTLFHRA